MIRISTIFIAICMVLVAASLGLVLYSMAGISGMESAIAALTALTFLILYNAVSMRLKDRSDVGTQIADLSRGTADLARQVAEFGRRLASLENRSASAEHIVNSRVDPLAGEINELGTLMKQLAVSVAPHADALAALAEASGVMPKIDNQVLLRCVQVLRRLLVRNKDIGLFCNIAAVTLRDVEVFKQCLDFLDANRALAPSLVLEFRQSAFRSLGPLESEHLAALAQRGFRFSIDNVTDLRIEPRELADRGVRFVKVPSALLLDQNRVSTSDIHPADLSDLLGRFGIDLVAERIEGERAVVDLLDYDVRFGQGFLFAPPRPLRPEGASATGGASNKSQESHGSAKTASVDVPA